jgi:hypothetical protein
MPIRSQKSLYKHHHFDKLYYSLYLHHKYLQNMNGFFSFLEWLHLLPRQSSLVSGGGQMQVLVVSLHRPPLKQALPSEPHTTAEQSSPAKPDEHIHVGNGWPVVAGEQTPLFKQTNPLVPHTSV